MHTTNKDALMESSFIRALSLTHVHVCVRSARMKLLKPDLLESEQINA